MALPVNIDDLVNHRKVESARIEYKEGWNPEKVLHTLCAFANDIDNWGGGYVILGVAEKSGKPIFPVKGLPPDSIDRIQKELLGVCHLIEPLYLPVVEPVEYKGKMLIVVWAPGGVERPYSCPDRILKKGKSPKSYYIRKMASTVKASRTVVKELFELAGDVPFDDRPNMVPVPTQYRTSTVPVTDPVKKLLAALRDGPCSPSDLRIAVGIKHRQTFRANYLNPAVRAGFICAKDGLSPHDPNICYSLTNLGCAILNENSSGVKEGVNEEAKALGDPINGREKDPINETVNEGVNEGVNQLLKIVVENPGKRANDLASLLGKSVHTVERYVKLLKVAGKIEFRGAPKNGGYYKK